MSLLGNLEADTLLEPQSPEDPGGVFYEAQVVKNADDPLFQVFLPSKKIDEFAEVLRVQMDGQGIDRKIPPVEVELERAMLHPGQGCGMIVVFQTGRGQVQPVTRGKVQRGRAKFFMDPQ